MAKDNPTAHNADVYDEKVRNTIPYYDRFHEETIDLVKSLDKKPRLWLDTGCGTGTLVNKALKSFPSTTFILADPSEKMLEEARKKLDKDGKGRVTFLPGAGTRDLTPQTVGEPDVITAIQSHHYYKGEGRSEATKVCFDLLSDGGVYITFENIRPLTKVGLRIGIDRWRRFQINAGRDAEADRHMARFDVEYHPITAEEHLELLRRTGFKTVEILWYSQMQAGFYAIK